MILLRFDVRRVDQLAGVTAGVHFIFEAGAAPVAVFGLKLDKVPLCGERNRTWFELDGVKRN